MILLPLLEILYFFVKNFNTIFAKGSITFKNDYNIKNFIVLIKESDTSKKEIENEIQINVNDTFSLQNKINIKLNMQK